MPPPPATPIGPSYDATAMPRVEDPRVTVVVATRNRRDDVLRTLSRHRAPVILVDNASTDGTADAVRRAYPHVDVVELRRNVAAAARTRGVARASTPFVAFADDDSWWAPGSLREAADALEAHPDVGLVTVETLVGPEDRRDPFTTVLAASPLSWPEELPGPRVLGFMGCAAIVRRDAFLEAGGFDDVVRFPGEEQRLAWDLTSRGRPLVYLSGPVVHHHPSPRREAADRRRRGLTRSRVVTAVMRLPWREVRVLVRAELRDGPEGRRGVVDSLARMPAALAARRVAPPELLTDLAAVEAGTVLTLGRNRLDQQV